MNCEVVFKNKELSFQFFLVNIDISAGLPANNSYPRHFIDHEFPFFTLALVCPECCRPLLDPSAGFPLPFGTNVSACLGRNKAKQPGFCPAVCCHLFLMCSPCSAQAAKLTLGNTVSCFCSCFKDFFHAASCTFRPLSELVHCVPTLSSIKSFLKTHLQAHPCP